MKALWVLLLLGLCPGAAADNPNPIVTTLTLFAGTPSGLWRSKDWAGTWEFVKGTGAPEGVGAVHVIVPLGPWVYLGGEGGLYFSEDFGLTWTQLFKTAPVLSLCPSRYPQADPTVFVGTPDGLLKSSDAGRHFAPTPLKGTAVLRIEWPGPALLVATGHGVLTSLDGGESFSGPGAGLPDGETVALAYSSFYSVDPVAFTGVGTEGVFRSSDGTKTWVRSGLRGHTVTDLFWLGRSLYAVTGEGLFRSEDVGESWSALAKVLGAPRKILFPLAPDSGAETLLATESGLYRSTDGGDSWQPAGLKGEAVLCIATFPALERKRNKKPK
jgi:photosystem II stability/assembly factor-like uncharacterized protein